MDDAPITDVNAGTWDYLKKHPVWLWVPGTATFAVIIFLAFFAAAIGNGNVTGTVVGFLFLGMIAGYAIVRQKVQDAFMRQFAEANGYQFSVFGDYLTQDGALFRLGNGTRSMRDVVDGTYLGCPIELFDYAYETGSGKTRQTHPYTVFRLQFDTAMPDLLLEARNAFSSDSLMGQLPERIKLEGDFDKYFNLTIRKGYEVEALEVFTPDVMQELIAKCRNFSVEIVNNHLFIYDNTTLGTSAGLAAFYDAAKYFVQTLGPVLARMKPALQAQAAVAAEEPMGS